MKNKAKLYLTCFISIILISAFSSCEREVAEPDPPLGLYKTNPEYFPYFAPSINEKGKVVITPYYTQNDPRIYITDDDTLYSSRIALDGGYVLSAEVWEGAPFSDASFKECFMRQDTDSPVTAEILYERIIDRDPFTEYYDVDIEFVTKYQDQFVNLDYSPGKVKYLSFQEAAKEINLIIAEGRLEEYFKKVR